MNWIQAMNRCTGPRVCTCSIATGHQYDNDACPRNHCEDCNQLLRDHINGCPTYPPMGTPGVTCPAAAAGVAGRQEPRKRWPFVESPGAFTARLEAAMEQFPTLLAAVRYVLIETPPTLAAGERPADVEQPDRHD